MHTEPMDFQLENCEWILRKTAHFEPLQEVTLESALAAITGHNNVNMLIISQVLDQIENGVVLVNRIYSCEDTFMLNSFIPKLWLPANYGTTPGRTTINHCARVTLEAHFQADAHVCSAETMDLRVLNISTHRETRWLTEFEVAACVGLQPLTLYDATQQVGILIERVNTLLVMGTTAALQQEIKSRIRHLLLMLDSVCQHNLRSLEVYKQVVKDLTYTHTVLSQHAVDLYTHPEATWANAVVFQRANTVFNDIAPTDFTGYNIQPLIAPRLAPHRHTLA